MITRRTRTEKIAKKTEGVRGREIETEREREIEEEIESEKVRERKKKTIEMQFISK